MIRNMMNGLAISIGIIIGNQVIISFIIELKGRRLLHLCKYFRYLYQSQKELNKCTPKQYNMTRDFIDYNPGDIIKKEARGVDEADLGEVQEISGEYIIIQKGKVDKDKFYIPKNLLERFDGDIVYLRVTEEEVKQYKKE